MTAAPFHTCILTGMKVSGKQCIICIIRGTGKVEENETGLESAYRELEEESGITKEDIVLTHLMTCNYQMSNNELQVYIGKLKKEVKVVEEVNKLYWIDASENFFDMSKYAGEGIIGHIIEQVKLYKDKLLKEVNE